MKQQYFNLYTANQARELDRLAMEAPGASGYRLMKTAGASAFHFIMSAWPNTKSLTVVCGIGNNGGDGYVIAKFAISRGIDVSVIQLGDLSKQRGDALAARLDLEADDVVIEPYQGQSFSDTDVIVDALLGTGLTRDVTSQWREVIEAINLSPAKVASVDIPSGLNADTGTAQGVAIDADVTATFMGRKQGMFTGVGCQKSGLIKFDSLNVPENIYQQVPPASFLQQALSPLVLRPRDRNTHKGKYGKVVVVGGAPGMNGAILLSAIAALRTGCGSVTVLTHPQHAAFLNMKCPEIMCRGIEEPFQLNDYLAMADAVVVGPGLGTDSWGKDLLTAVIEGAEGVVGKSAEGIESPMNRPVIIDADGLRQLGDRKSANANWVLTPHPGEAASMLGCSVDEIQQDRFLAAKRISEKYNAVCILKGAGTITYFSEKLTVCPFGNPGMATAGMGDVLSGILGTLAAQGVRQQFPLVEMAGSGVLLHAIAGDQVARQNGEKGMIASDLYPQIRGLINAR